MKLYILRHGHAPSIQEAKVASDAERPLSDDGRQAVRQVVGSLIERGGNPSLILHSPLKRAVETAHEAAALLRLQGYSESFLPLSNSMGAEELYRNLADRAIGVNECLVIGHQPQLGDLASWLSRKHFLISPSGLVALETRPSGPAAVLWSINPSEPS